MNDQLDRQISDSENRLAAICSQIDQVRRRFIDAYADFLGAWFSSQVQAEIKRNANLTKSLPEEKLKELKTEVMALQDASHQIAEKFLSEPHVWWKPGKQPVGTGDAPVGAALKLAAGSLIPVLRKFGYPDPFPNAKSRDVFGTRWETDLRWSEEMSSIHQEYVVLVAEGVKAGTLVSKLKTEKEERLAVDRWEKL